MKAILVIDMPKSCADCSYCGYEQFTMNPACVICESHLGKDEDIENNRSVICPLRPLPKHKYGFENNGLSPSDQILVQSGWNDCLAEITGETE